MPKEARWSYLKGKAPQPTIGRLVDDAMSAIERDNPSLKGVLPKDYARPGLDKQRLGLFRNNHFWAMDRGEESLRLELARRHARTLEERASIPAPPPPTWPHRRQREEKVRTGILEVASGGSVGPDGSAAR